MAGKRRFGDDDVTPEPRPGPMHSHMLDNASSKSNVSPSTQDGSIRGASTGQTSFASSASIVLIGIRGTGKSSLAIMASSALRFRVVDADQHFFQTTGQSRAAFKAKHGVKEYRRRELQVMHSILLDNQSRCVITCGPGSVEGKGKGLLRDYAQTHPVIYIMRDADDIQRYLRA